MILKLIDFYFYIFLIFIFLIVHGFWISLERTQCWMDNSRLWINWGLVQWCQNHSNNAVLMQAMSACKDPLLLTAQALCGLYIENTSSFSLWIFFCCTAHSLHYLVDNNFHNSGFPRYAVLINGYSAHYLDSLLGNPKSRLIQFSRNSLTNWIRGRAEVSLEIDM